MALQVYLVLAQHTPSYQQPLLGYLVEHMRVGEGDTLRMEYRDIPYVATTSALVQATALAAGHMVVTRYTLEQATSFWDTSISPTLARFCHLAKQLIEDPELLDMYVWAEDKDLWFSEHCV